MAQKPKAQAAPMDMAPGGAAERSDVEQAVLGHGPNVGPFNEGHGLRLVRDPKFPIRVTVQFYKATSNGVASETDLDSIARSIGSVYEHAEFVGSQDSLSARPPAWYLRRARRWTWPGRAPPWRSDRGAGSG